MDDPIIVALVVSGIGMLMLFLALAFLYGLMVLMTRITSIQALSKDRPEAEEAGSGKQEAGSRRQEARGRKQEAGWWVMDAGSWVLGARSWKLGARSWQLITNH